MLIILYDWFLRKSSKNSYFIHYALENNNDGLSNGHCSINPGEPIDNLPTYSLKDVSEHNDPEKSVWIIYNAGVYDITSFVQIHPGGSENILLGAGNSIEPFWHVYSQHHTEQIYQLLESFRIGNLTEEDRKKLSNKDNQSLSDSLEYIPKRDPCLLVHHEKPFNAETPGEILVKNFYTPKFSIQFVFKNFKIIFFS